MTPYCPINACEDEKRLQYESAVWKDTAIFCMKRYNEVWYQMKEKNFGLVLEGNRN